LVGLRFVSCCWYRHSAGFAFRARRRRGAAAGIEHGIDELEHSALIGGREFFDALEPLQEPCGLGRERVTHRGDAEERISGTAERAREIDEHRAGRLCAIALVVVDHTIGDADRGAQLFLREAAGLAKRGQARAKAFEGALLHGITARIRRDTGLGKAGKDTEDHAKVANRMVKKMDELGIDLEKNSQFIADDMEVYQHETFKTAQSATKGAEEAVKREYGWPW